MHRRTRRQRRDVHRAHHSSARARARCSPHRLHGCHSIAPTAHRAFPEVRRSRGRSRPRYRPSRSREPRRVPSRRHCPRTSHRFRVLRDTAGRRRGRPVRFRRCPPRRGLAATPGVSSHSGLRRVLVWPRQAPNFFFAGSATTGTGRTPGYGCSRTSRWMRHRSSIPASAESSSLSSVVRGNVAPSPVPGSRRGCRCRWR